MSPELLIKTIPCDKFDLMNKGDVVTLYKGAEKIINHLQSELNRLSSELNSFEQKSFFLEEDVVALRKKYLIQVQRKESLGSEEMMKMEVITRAKREFNFLVNVTLMFQLKK